MKHKSHLIRFGPELLFGNFQYARKLGGLCCRHFRFFVEFYGLKDLKQTTTSQINHNQRKKKTLFHSETHQMFSVHITPKKFKKVTITGHLRSVFEEELGKEIT